MGQGMVKTQALIEEWFVVCTLGGGLCVETTNQQKARTIADVLHCSIHSEIRASRASFQ